MKYLLITGASSGIGRTIASGLSEKYNLVISGRNLENLNETKKLCSPKSNVLIFCKDLNETETLENDMTSFISSNSIEISHFVHCAGMMKLIPIKMLTLEIIRTTLNTNMISAALLIKVLINRKTNKGALKSVVFISSNVSNFGAKALSLYGASKSGLDGFMRSMAVELAPGVRINSVLPGAIKTEMTKEIFDNEAIISRMESTYPLGSGKSEDILGIVEFLLSEKANWITGQQFTVDGGRTVNLTG